MGRIELPTSPLPRGCSTTEPHGPHVAAVATRHVERETGFPVDPYPIDSTEVFGTPLCLTDWIMYYPCCLGKRFLTTPLQVLVFWSYRLFILPDHCLHAPGQQQPCGD